MTGPDGLRKMFALNRRKLADGDKEVRMPGLEFWLLAGLAAMLVGAGKGGVPVVAMLSVVAVSVAVGGLA